MKNFDLKKAVVEPEFLTFPDPLAASMALAEFVAEQLTDAIDARGRASLVLSGGRSPASFFHELSRISLPWTSVTILLADERCVAVNHPDRNERLVRQRLLTWMASTAMFISAVDGPEPRDAAVGANRWLASAPAPFDIVVLGMGADGHTASIFPDSPQLEQALDANAARSYLYVESPSVSQPRVTLNANALCHARCFGLLMHGDDKLEVYRRARQPGPVAEFPIRLALHHPHVACRVFWSK